MVFQDFDIISERRRQERQRKFRRRVAFAIVFGAILVAVIAGGAFVVITSNKNNQHEIVSSGGGSNSSGGSSSTSNKNTPSKSTEQPSNEVTNVQRLIKTVCNSTTYKDTCQTTLKKAADKNPSTQPKDLVKVAIQAADDEFDTVLDKTSSFQFQSPKEKAAFDDCKILIENAKEELGESISSVRDNIGENSHELNNWLSAVMSYQQTCIDGFPEGKLKNDMQKTFKGAKEQTSNSLAMVSLFESFISSFKIPEVPKRSLLTDKSRTISLDKEGLPHWINYEDRRMLKGAKTNKPKANATVAKDGSGDFKTISAALASIPSKYEGRYIIYVKGGIYDETVTVDKKMENVTMYGDGSQKSIITGKKNFVDGVQTFRTASAAILGNGFVAMAMGFRNTAGPEKHQAVALRVQADRSVFLNCRFEGFQDTLYVQTHRQFYRSCVIVGTIDFIFGDASAVFQNCLIQIRKPMENQQNIVTAQGRIDKNEDTGIVLQSCRIEPDKTLVPNKAKFKSYLGRPWKEYARTIIMESTIEDLIHPDGWLAWEGNKGLNTLYYAEYNNQGPGAKTNARVKWPGYHATIKKEEAIKYTVGPFLQGEWINATNSPVHFGLN